MLVGEYDVKNNIDRFLFYLCPVFGTKGEIRRYYR